MAENKITTIFVSLLIIALLIPIGLGAFATNTNNICGVLLVLPLPLQNAYAGSLPVYNVPYNDFSSSKTMNNDSGSDVALETFKANSQFIGQNINHLKYWIYDSGSNHNGHISISIYNQNRNLVRHLGQINISDLDNSFDRTHFHELSFTPYTIRTLDSIVFELIGGNTSTTTSEIMIDNNVFNNPPYDLSEAQQGQDIHNTVAMNGGGTNLSMELSYETSANCDLVQNTLFPMIAPISLLGIVFILIFAYYSRRDN